MPEGDTLHKVAARLRPALVGHGLVRFEAPRLRGERPGQGERIEAVEARGKHLLIHFGGGLSLRTHLRMSGSWHLYRSGERWRRPRHQLRALVEADNGWLAVCFAAPEVETYRHLTNSVPPAPPPGGSEARDPGAGEGAGPARVVPGLPVRRKRGPVAPVPSEATPGAPRPWRHQAAPVLPGVTPVVPVLSEVAPGAPVPSSHQAAPAVSGVTPAMWVPWEFQAAALSGLTPGVPLPLRRHRAPVASRPAPTQRRRLDSPPAAPQPMPALQS